MKTPLSWISLYTPLAPLLKKHTIKELAHEYSIHTAEIDGIEEHFLDKVVIGKVLSCEKHPESKKLSIVEVLIGWDEKTIILTGAANIVDATYVAVATVGAILPGDFVIGERMMAGMMSRGMICSDDELGLATERSEGIMILEEQWNTEILESMIGKSFFDLHLPFPGMNGEIYNFPLRDTTFEIDNKFITNRPDLFSVIGNAREWHAVFDIPFIPHTSKNTISSGKEKFPVQIETDKVLAYHTLKMENITVGKSPFGMKIMMERAWLGSKMDIVDITNCMLTEFGQPMHAFDADKIAWGIIVRMAKTGEKILALNGVEYTLTSEDLVIADHNGPIAIAGVIGGMESAVSLESKNIVWESATFDAVSIRLTAQRHGIRTDASTRYEKSLDPLLPTLALPRVIEYMQFLGKKFDITASSSYLQEKSVNHITIDIDYNFINMKAGIEIPKEEVNAILWRLEFKLIIDNWQLIITIPSWRASKDISIKEDIAEEVARVYGYDNTPLTPLSANFSIAGKNHEIILRNTTLSHFSERGYNEIYSYSFTNENLDKKIWYENMESAIGIRNSFNEEYTHMRRSIAPRLFLAAMENMKYASNFSFFEIGKVYRKSDTKWRENTLLQNIAIKPFPEKKELSGVIVWGTLEELRRTLEGYLERTLSYVPPIHSGTDSNLFHPNISGSYREDDIVLIRFGEVHPEIAHHFELGTKTLYFEIDYEKILELSRENDMRFHPISKYQTIPRELNFVMPEHTPTGDVAHIIDAVHPWIQNIVIDSVYIDSKKIGEWVKSVNFSFLLSNHDATISDAEALNVQNMVIEKMKDHGYSLRS